MNAMVEDRSTSHDSAGSPRNPSELTLALLRRWKLLVVVPLLAGVIAVGATYVLPVTFTARTSFLPPQQANAAANALTSLGALANLAGGGGIRTPADQFVAFMQSASLQDRIIDRFKLIEVYDVRFRADARRELTDHVRVALSKRDGIIGVEVDDHVPQRAAEMANAYVEELRRMVATLAITEAQQRRVFFEGQLAQTRDRLAAAQRDLQQSGINAGTLKAEPKAAAEAFAKLRAEATAAEVRLEGLRRSLVDTAPEVQQQLAVLSTLRAQVGKLEAQSAEAGSGDYISRYRDFKYQETLLELFARQYELARVDEAREGSLIQVIDVAQPPERKSRPRRAQVGLLTLVGTLAALLALIAARERWRTLGPALKAGLRQTAPDR